MRPAVIVAWVAVAGCCLPGLAAAAPSAPVSPNRDAIAVVIGVSEYRNRDIPPADFALNDAAAIRKFLVSSLGYLPDNVIYKQDPTAADLLAIFGNEKDANGQLRSWIREGRSDVFVYYSGHGSQDQQTSKGYLIPSDADPQRLALTAYPRDLLLKNLEMLPARSLTVVLETCFSGVSDKGPIGTGTSATIPVLREEIGGLSRGVLLTSARSDQVSTWYPRVGYSLFTFYLLKGLNGAADQSPVDGKVTAGELQAYLSQEVPYQARRAGRTQSPVVTSPDPNQVLVSIDDRMKARLAEMENQESLPSAPQDERRPDAPQTPSYKETGSGVLYVDSDPPGAQVYVDAEPKGSTPLEVTGVVEGLRKVTLRSPGYETVSQMVTLEAGGREIIKTILSEQTGSLKVESSPAGAAVYLDGKYLGPAPQEVKSLKVGAHTVKGDKSDYESREETVSVEYQQASSVKLELKGKPGKLAVFSTPEGADVSLDGKVVGKTPWNGTAAAGAHEIVVSLKEYASQKKSVTLAPNGAETADLVLKKGPSALADGADGAPMVLVPAGEFLMGSADSDSQAWAEERPQHRVTLKSFYMDRYEVTNARYGRFVKETGRTTPTSSVDPKWNVWQGGWYPEGVAKHPVVNVTWDDARAYCAWVGKRQPTEAEWEKAARGTDGRIYPWGNRWDGSLANSSESGRNSTVEVGSYPGGASAYGVEDMAGNVWEWVSDWHDEKYYNRSPAQDPTGPSSGQFHVLRGGSWLDVPRGLRSASRFRYGPTCRNCDIGFRCAQDQFP